MPNLIGISLGDVTGIGPEVTLKALASEDTSDATRYLLIGDAAHIRSLEQRLELKLGLQPFQNKGQPGRVFITNPLSEPLPLDLVKGSPAAARAAEIGRAHV